MRYLVFCTCGHSVESHVSGVCTNRSGGRCTCDAGETTALERAIEAAKRESFAAFRPVDRPAPADAGNHRVS